MRAVSHACITCKKEHAKTASQCMGQLPEARITPSPPFPRTGTDFAGPLQLKKGHTRKPVMVKGYVCLFVCLSTRAVHLELVMDLSTDAFLAAFRRFAARRGCPGELYSDNGSNYVGANRELRRIYDLLTSKNGTNTLFHYFNNVRVKWHFIPGRAPHFGGLWESGIKAAKSYIRKIVGTHSMTVEESISVLNEVEAVLNSRPLCTLNVSPEDGIEVLTPAHFLVGRGRSLRAPPQPASEELVISNRRRWNLCQHLTYEFWKRWSTDYLQQLQKRTKWKQPLPNFKKGDVVLLKDTELFIRTWPLAVVEEVYPGQDGLVRAVSVRTSKGTYKRPIHKLDLLFDTEEHLILSSPRGECSSRMRKEVLHKLFHLVLHKLFHLVLHKLFHFSLYLCTCALYSALIVNVRRSAMFKSVFRFNVS